MNQTENNFYSNRPNINDNKNKLIKSSKFKNRFINKYTLLKTFSPNSSNIQNLYGN